MAESAASKMWAAVAAVKAKGPLVQCLTNFVSMDIMANGLLALGASPAMIHSVDELADAIPIVGATGGAVNVNIGTLDECWIESFKVAVALCKQHGVPWVLDPVAAGFTKLRTNTAKELLDLHAPTVLRGNGSEIMALAPADDAVGGGKGVDSTEGSEAAIGAAKRLVGRYPTMTVCVSGETDYVISMVEGRAVVATSKHSVPMLAKVTATGCTLNAVIAAFVASRPEGTTVHEETASACTYYVLCAERAAAASKGPGSFRAEFLDQLYLLTQESAGGMAVNLVLDSGL